MKLSLVIVENKGFRRQLQGQEINRRLTIRWQNEKKISSRGILNQFCVNTCMYRESQSHEKERLKICVAW